MRETWDDKYEYLSKGRFIYHNDDYIEFLVEKVWKITTPVDVIDFGCGFGFVGYKILPLLPPGSTYTGIDSSPVLIEKARKLFEDSSFKTEFREQNVYSTDFNDNSFDIAICHTVLMHLENPLKALSEMNRLTKKNGLLITCEANRNAHSAMFNIFEERTQEDIPLRDFQTI